VEEQLDDPGLIETRPSLSVIDEGGQSTRQLREVTKPCLEVSKDIQAAFARKEPGKKVLGGETVRETMGTIKDSESQ